MKAMPEPTNISERLAVAKASGPNMESLSRLCGIHGRLLEYTFENWDKEVRVHSRDQEEGALVQPIAEAFDGTFSLVFHSQKYGSGKTWAACSILRRWIERDHRDSPLKYKTDDYTGQIYPARRHESVANLSYIDMAGIPGLFVSMAQILGQIRATYSGDSTESETSIVRRLQVVPLLVLDDVATQPPTDRQFEPRITHAIIDYRYNANLPVIITTNKGPDGLVGRLWGATISRLHQMGEFIHLEEIDYRLMRRKK